MQVSRCGMIYMEPQRLGWRPLFKSWLHTLPLTFYEEHKRILSNMFERFVDPCLALVRKGAKVPYLFLFLNFFLICFLKRRIQRIT